MARYRTVHERFWVDEKVDTLKLTEKLLFIYLITNSHSDVSGIYCLKKSLISDETKLSIPEVEAALKTLEAQGIVFYDHDRQIVLVKNMYNYQCARGDKLRAHIEDHIANLPKTNLIKKLTIPYRYPIDTLSIPYRSKRTVTVTVNSNSISNSTSTSNNTSTSNIVAKPRTASRRREYSLEFNSWWDIWKSHPAHEQGSGPGSKAGAFKHWPGDDKHTSVLTATTNYLEDCLAIDSKTKHGERFLKIWEEWLDKEPRTPKTKESLAQKLWRQANEMEENNDESRSREMSCSLDGVLSELKLTRGNPKHLA